MGFAKPIDAGTGRVCASFLPDGSWLSIATFHPVHGLVELSGMPAFDERSRGDPAAVRRYRELMASRSSAFLWFERATVAHVAADAPAGSDAIRLLVRLAPGGAARGAALHCHGRLDRPALAEITETHPSPPTGARTRFEVHGHTLWIAAPELPAAAVLDVDRGSWRLIGDASAVLELSDDADHDLVAITVQLGSVEAAALRASRAAPAEAEPSMPEPPSARRSRGAARPLEPTVERMTRAALAYIRGCTTLEVATGERVILTDHRILPLSWTRDAYWQALALLAADAPGDRERVADHLRWLWRRCERPDGRWVRSHHANGRRKDLAFQADQQLYPLVELADYWRLTERLPDGVEWDLVVARAWTSALAAIDSKVGLIASTENAADDPAAAPFIAASQILLWYTARRLAELAERGALSTGAGAFERTATDAHAAFQARLASADGAWPYAVDEGGQRVAYHDANDLPVALAPVWGFCGADDPGWRATMAFAFSPGNPGWFDGDRPGLGSAHTPGPWTLGDVQAWLRATIVGDAQGMADALRRLETVAFADGMLPEAYAATGDARIRHWFAWPGAVLAALRILDRDARMTMALAVRASG